MNPSESVLAEDERSNDMLSQPGDEPTEIDGDKLEQVCGGISGGGASGGDH
jgi:hypothetical protein